jgi:hypothetical protein
MSRSARLSLTLACCALWLVAGPVRPVDGQSVRALNQEIHQELDDHIDPGLKELAEALQRQHKVYGLPCGSQYDCGSSGHMTWHTSIEPVLDEDHYGGGVHINASSGTLWVEFRVRSHDSHEKQLRGSTYDDPTGETFRIMVRDGRPGERSSFDPSPAEVRRLEAKRMGPHETESTLPGEMLDTSNLPSNAKLERQYVERAIRAYQEVQESWQRVLDLHDQIEERGGTSYLDEIDAD